MAANSRVNARTLQRLTDMEETLLRLEAKIDNLFPPTAKAAKPAVKKSAAPRKKAA